MLSFNAKKLAALVLGIGLSALNGCGGEAQVSSATNLKEAAPGVSQPLIVQVYDVVPSVSRGDLLIPASLSIEGVATVAARRDGAIAQLTVQEGSRVAKGGVLARLSGDEELRTQLRQAELEAERVKVEQSQLEALIRLHRNELERERALATQGLSSPKDVERAEFKFEAATLELSKAKVAFQVAQAKAEEVKVQLQRSIVTAAISGIITRLYIQEGSSVARNDKILEITPASQLQVKFQVPQSERARLARGSIVGISLIDGGDTVIASARIRRLQPVADAASNTLGYVADVIAGKGLQPGLAVNVRVPRSVSGPDVLVPQTAFSSNSELRRGTAATVFVIEGDKCAVRSVWVNGMEGDQVEIGSGLETGDRIILSPPSQLRPGDSVTTKN